MKKFISNFITGFAVIFSIPTLLIMISWNALPGVALYSLKTGMEDLVLKMALRTPLASQLSVKYTQRRYSEATKLLSQKGSTLGYTLLVQEAQESKNTIVSNNDSQEAGDLIEKIEEYQRNIEEKQFAIQTGGIVVPTASTYNVPGTTTPVKTTAPIATPVSQVPSQKFQTPKPTPLVVVQATSSAEVIEDLEKAKNDLEDIKEKIKKELPESASDRAKEVHEDKLDNKTEKDENKDRGEGDD